MLAEETQRIGEILSQKFTYLAQGHQSYAFRSADGSYVLKFIKYQRLRPNPWLDFLGFLPPVGLVRESQAKSRRDKLERLYQSWKLAFDEMAPEAGLIYVQLNPCRSPVRSVTLINPDGQEFQLDLSDSVFLLQKHAPVLCLQLTDCINSKRLPEARELIDRVVQHVVSGCARGLCDEDGALIYNTGILDGEPILIDVGKLVHNEQLRELSVCQQTLKRKTRSLRKWLRARSPDLEQYVNQLIQNKQRLEEYGAQV